MTKNTGEITDLKASDYVHLHNHTHHSLLDGLTKIDELIDKVKESGMTACAITDHGTMSGSIDFYNTCKSKGVKPIIGMEAYVAARHRKDRDPQKDKTRYHLIILAMNHTGYENLMRLSTMANLEGFYFKPRIDHEILEKYNEGLIILSGCAGGELGHALRNDDYEKAKEVASWYKGVFGDRYYLELQDHGHPDAPSKWDVQVKINDGLVQLSEDLGIEMVVSSDAHYINHEDQDVHEILLCIGTGSYLSDEVRMSLKEFELHVTNPSEIIARWKNTYPEAVRNTKVIADRCDLVIEFGRTLIPKYPCPDNISEKEYLHTLVYRGLAVRYNGYKRKDTENMSISDVKEILDKEVLERAEMELEVLGNMGFEGYFLIVQDFMNWGKERGIIFGPGRGSAAGAIIAYALNITDLDPLKYELLFERFLNPDRISMPDIDIDIQDTRRDEVIDYCSNKYGENQVSNILTFGKMAARAAVRDVARVLEVPYSEADRLAKIVPQAVQGRHVPIKKSIVEDPDLKKEYENNQTAKTVLDYAMRLEGTIRSHGVHACGVVIAPDELVKYIPLERSQKGVIATQFPMNEVEALGLLKMDFLGLSNLTIINNAMRIIKKVYNEEIDLSALSLDNKKAYELFQRGDTTGVFQLESAGMKRYLRGLKPTVFEDIIAMVALYRPGPMQFIDEFIKRKHGQSPITYMHEGMKNSLENTYGILVYQEQFMKISKEWCGFTGGQADTLRKAVGKKKVDLMMKIKPEFIDGAVKYGNAPREVAEKFWGQLEAFADYCFNKSHAACYGLIAYWTAYLKANFPDAFMAALMTSDEDDIDRLAIEISECKQMGIHVLSPNINESFVEFAIVPGKNQIRFGLAAIKGVGVGAVEEILRARNEGKFESIEDFCKRTATGRVNRRVWESLIKTGAFDLFADRSDLMYNLDDILAFAQKMQKEAMSGQADLFGDFDDESVKFSLELKPAPTKFTEKEQLTWERELMGLYISAHPLDNYTAFFEEQAVPVSSITPKIDEQTITVGGLITTYRTIVTKNGKKMAFVGLEDRSGDAEVIIFPNLYEKIGGQIAQDVVVKISGKVSARDRDGNLGDEAKLIADELNFITDKELKEYNATGKKMFAPTTRGAYKKKTYPTKNGVSGSSSHSANSNSIKSSKSSSNTSTPPKFKPLPKELQKKTVYIHIKNPQNIDILTSLKSICEEFSGDDEVILVLGEDKKNAIKAPFTVKFSKSLENKILNITGEGTVKAK